MTLYAVVPFHLAIRQERGILNIIARLLLYGLANDYLRIEHLELTISESRPIIVAVGAVDCKVVSLTPHATRAELHIEAFFAFIDQMRFSLACPVIEIPYIDIFFALILFFESLFLGIESCPEMPVLDALDP